MALDKGSVEKYRHLNSAYMKEKQKYYADASLAAVIIAGKNGRTVIEGEALKNFRKKSAEKIYSFGQIDKHAVVREALVKAAANASPEKIKELGIDKYLQ